MLMVVRMLAVLTLHVMGLLHVQLDMVMSHANEHDIEPRPVLL